MSEQKTMTQILSSQRVIAFNPLFADVVGDVVAGLMLSQLCYWSERTNRQDGWFYKSQDEWFTEARLTRSNIETARKKLQKLGVISYRLMGVPAVGHYRVNYLLLEAKIKEIYEKNPNKNTRLLESSKQDSGNPANKVAGKQQTRLLESSKQDSGNPANKVAGIAQTITESTQENKQRVKTNTSYSAEKESDLAHDKAEQELLAARIAARTVESQDVRTRGGFDEALKNLGIKVKPRAQKQGQGEAQAQN